jgi:hypothetical protein
MKKNTKTSLKIQKKLYYLNNIDKFKAKSQQRYQNNREKELLNAKERKYTCTMCGICIRTDCRIRHETSRKHIDYDRQQTN